MPDEKPPRTASPKPKPRENFDGLIRDQVMHHLGTPEHLWQVQVRRLWDDCYRVNVFVGGAVESARIAHSSFIKTDDRGNILVSDPAISRRY